MADEKTYTVTLTESEMNEVYSALDSYNPYGTLVELRNTPPDFANREERIKEMEEICDGIQRLQDKFQVED